MMMYSAVVFVSLGLLAAGYPSGPPVDDDHSELCVTMMPTGHGASVQASTAPYEYILSQNCYNEGVSVHVAIKANAADAKLRYFEGFFTQAQESSVTGDNYGTFSTVDAEYSNTYNCFSKNASAVGQMKKKHFASRVFAWEGPTDSNTTVHFRSTIVKSKTTFWTEVMSDAVTYSADCVQGTFNEMASIQGKDEDDTNGSTSTFPGALAALATLSMALLLQ